MGPSPVGLTSFRGEESRTQMQREREGGHVRTERIWPSASQGGASGEPPLPPLHLRLTLISPASGIMGNCLLLCEPPGLWNAVRAA